MSGDSGRRARVSPWLIAATLGVSSYGGVGAHDFWIEPGHWAPRVGEALSLRLRVGEDFQGEAVLRRTPRIERFVVFGPDGEHAVSGVEGGDPAGLIRPAVAGLHVVGYQSRPTPIALAADKFEAYLVEEGLEHVRELRAASGESLKPGREIYSRCAKSLIVVGEQHGTAFDRVLGLPLELITEGDTGSPASGAQLPVRLLYGGVPLPGALVVALHRETATLRQARRTDAQGRVAIDLPHSGAWLIKAVHMVRATPGSGADWESLWASLTFRTNPPARR